MQRLFALVATRSRLTALALPLLAALSPTLSSDTPPAYWLLTSAFGFSVAAKKCLFASGFTLSLRFALSASTNARLFRLTSPPDELEAFVGPSGAALVLRRQGRRSSARFATSFVPSRWYAVAFVVAEGRALVGKSTAALFVDGACVATEPLPYLRQAKEMRILAFNFPDPSLPSEPVPPRRLF